MQTQPTLDPKLKEGIRAIQQAYITRFPEKREDLIRGVDMDRIRGMYAYVKGDVKFITGIIESMKHTASGEVPGWAYVDTVVKQEYKQQVEPTPAKTEAEILAMCDLTPKQQMYLNISKTMIGDILPALDPDAEEITYLTGFDDLNILVVLNALHEDGRISDDMLRCGKLGHALLSGELKELAESFKPEMAEV